MQDQAPSGSYSELDGGEQYADVYEALAQVVPPSEDHWLPSIAIEVQDLVDNSPWLGRELRYYYSALKALPDLVNHLRLHPPSQLPKHFVGDYPAQAALAIVPTTDTWIRPAKALMLTLALRVLHPALTQHGSPDNRAEQGFTELVRFIKGLNFRNVRDVRAAFLRAAESESSPVSYARALSSLMEQPNQLPPSLESRSAKPDAELLTVLNRDILPLLEDLPAPQKVQTKVRDTEDWERDDNDEPDFRISLRLRPTPDTIEDAPEEDSVEILFDHAFDPGREAVDKLEAFEEPLDRTVSDTQSIHSANTHFLTFHADVLTHQELKHLLPAIRQSLDEAMARRDPGVVGLLLTLLMMFATGLTKERASAILSNDEPFTDDKAFLTDCCNELIVPAHKLPSNPQGGDRDQDLVRVSDHYVRIPMPPTLVPVLSDFRNNFPPVFFSNLLLNNIYPLLRTIADSVGLSAVTLGRLRRTAAPLLFEECNDLVAVMHLTRDTFGRSLAPMHYVSFDASVLRTIYRRAMWSQFDDDYKAANQSEIAGQAWIGSEFCPLETSARSACATIGSTLHAGKPSPESALPADIAQVHNTMAFHLASLLVAVVGHRPNSALFRLTVHDFDTELQLGLFFDKDIDPAHLTRLVALGNEVSAQIERYTSHLRGLIRCGNVPDTTRDRLRRILKGSGPLIFRLDENAHYQRWNIELWQAMLPPQWLLLKENFGRHYLASRGRELDFSPEWIHIHLGHQDVAGYPFSPDSPLFPAELTTNIGPLLDKIFKEQGWKRRNGFESENPLDDSWCETGPLRVTHSHSVRYRQKLNQAKSRFRDELRAQLRPIKSKAERILVQAALSVSSCLAQALCFRYNSQRSARGEELLDWPVSDRTQPKNLAHLSCAELDQPMMELLLTKLEKIVGDNRTLQIAVTNQLAYALEWLRKRRIYSGPYCGIYRMRPLPDESPFFEGIFRTTKQIHALRELFSRLRTSPYPRGSAEDTQWELGKVTFAVIIFGQVEEMVIVRGLLSSTAQLERIPASSDSLLVHLAEPETTVALNGIAAFSYSRWRKMHGGLDDAGEEAESLLNAALRTILNDRSLRKGHGIHALLQTMSAANRIEMPGLFRTILDPEQGSVALPPERLRSLLDPAFRPREKGKPPPEVTSWSLKRNHNISDIDAQVRKMKAMIPDSDSPEALHLTGEKINLKTRQYKPARDKLLAELERWTGHEKYDLIVRYLAGWLIHLICRPKHRGPGNLSWNTVQKYFGTVALPLVHLIGRGGMKELTVEDLEDIYLDLIAHQSKNKQAGVCTQLLSFHDFLVNTHGFEPVDASSFREYSSRFSTRNVSNQIVLPGERELVISHLRWLNEPDAHPPNAELDFRRHTQAYLCFALAAATGARIGEITGLKHKDVVRICNEIALLLRPNGYRRLKTTAARRLADASKHLSPDTLENLNSWLDSERERIGADRFHSYFIFCDLEQELIGTSALRSWFTPTMRAINNYVSSHHLRHTRLNEIFVALLLGLSLDELCQPEKVVSPSTCMPRDLMQETGQVGHRRPRTSGICYFHAPFAARIAAQRVLQASTDKKTVAAAMGISISGLDNLKQSCKKDYAGRFLDRCCPRASPSGVVTTPITSSLPGPNASSLPRLSKAVDLMARGVSVQAVRVSIGLTEAQVESLLDQDRKQAINTGIALIPGNPNGNKRNSNYPRWRAGSQVLQSLWSAIELKGDPDAQSLLRGWRLAANRSDRSIFLWDEKLIETVNRCFKTTPQIELKKKSKGQLYEVLCIFNGCAINHEIAYTLAVADVVAGSIETYGPRVRDPI